MVCQIAHKHTKLNCSLFYIFLLKTLSIYIKNFVLKEKQVVE